MQGFLVNIPPVPLATVVDSEPVPKDTLQDLQNELLATKARLQESEAKLKENETALAQAKEEVGLLWERVKKGWERVRRRRRRRRIRTRLVIDAPAVPRRLLKAYGTQRRRSSISIWEKTNITGGLELGTRGIGQAGTLHSIARWIPVGSTASGGVERVAAPSRLFLSSSRRSVLHRLASSFKSINRSVRVDANRAHEPFLPFPRPPLLSASRYASSMSPET